MPFSIRKIKPHTNPPPFNGDEGLSLDSSQAEKLLLLWRMMRQVHSGQSQSISRFIGFVIQAMGKPNSSSTSITFLPPIRHPITKYSTVVECIKQSQRLATASNMK